MAELISEGILNHPNATEIAKDCSKIRKFFENENIFITGGTGFLGTVHARRKAATLFSLLRHEFPNFAEKVALIPADVELRNCGISEADQELLKRQINFVFHAATTVKFNAHLSKALSINTRAIRHLIRIAQQMDQLRVGKNHFT